MSQRRTDIKRSDIKLINGDKWRFDFRENGYVIVSGYEGGGQTGKKKKEVPKWRPYLHAPDLESCLQYVFNTYNGSCEYLKYEELEDV